MPHGPRRQGRRLSPGIPIPHPVQPSTRRRPKAAAPRSTELVATAVALATVDPAQAMRAGGQALADPALSPSLRSDAYRAVGVASMQTGDLPAALVSLERGIEAARRAADASREARCWTNLGVAHLLLGAPEAALQAFARCLGFVEPGSELAASVCNNVGLIAEQFRLDEISLEFTDLAWAAMPPGPAKAAAGLSSAAAMCRLGRLVSARTRLAEVLVMVPSDAASIIQLDARSVLCWIDAREGRPEAAIAALVPLIAQADGAGLHSSSCRARELLADVLLDAGQPGRAIDILESALPLMARVSNNVDHEARRTLARAYAAVGRWQEAYETKLAAEPPPGASMAVHESFALLRRMVRSVDRERTLGDGSPLATFGDTVTAGSAAIARRHALTAGDHRLVTLLVEGRTNPELAELLGVSVNTVRNRLVRIMAKLGVHSRAAVAAKAVALGLVVR